MARARLSSDSESKGSIMKRILAVGILVLTVALIVFRQFNLVIILTLGVAIYGMTLTILGGIRIRKGQLPAFNI